MSIPVKIANSIFFEDEHTRYTLQNRNYILKDHNQKGLFLKEFENFKLPTKLYGTDLEPLTKKVLTSFKQLKRNVGILLSGLKGTGKTVQLKHLAINCNMPVIIIDRAYSGTHLLPFLNKMKQSCLIVFDEFEKVYLHREEQESILPLLDGLSSTPHIFALTVNGDVTDFLSGRPSRIRYKVNYESISKEMTKEILEDTLENKELIQEICEFLSLFKTLNIDTVLSLVEELNLFPDEKLKDVVNIFNLENPLSQYYRIRFHYNVIASENLGDETFMNASSDFQKLFGAEQIDYFANSLDSTFQKKLEIFTKKYSELSVRKHSVSVSNNMTLSEMLHYINEKATLDQRSDFNSEVKFNEELCFSNERYYIRFNKLASKCDNELSVKTKISDGNILIFINNVHLITCEPQNKVLNSFKYD